MCDFSLLFVESCYYYVKRKKIKNSQQKKRNPTPKIKNVLNNFFYLFFRKLNLKI